MRRPDFIARQSAHPSGPLGRLIAWIMARETRELNQRAIEILTLEPTDHVLEVGFGHGRTVERLAGLVPDGLVAGVDVSESMTRVASRRNRDAIAGDRVDLRSTDAASLPWADQRFDKALSVHTIYFWTDPRTCLREIHRVLRPGGRFALAYTRSESPRAASFPADVYSFYADDQIEALLASAGFSNTTIVPAGDAAIALSEP